MKAKPLNMEVLASPLALLLAVAGPEMLAEAMPLLREQMKLTPEKLALLLHRIANPDHVHGETNEATLRGMSPTTLRTMKGARELPQVIQGSVNSKD